MCATRKKFICVINGGILFLELKTFKCRVTEAKVVGLCLSPRVSLQLNGS